MNQCSQACSAAMRVAAGVEVELAYRGAARQIVDRMGRRTERAQGEQQRSQFIGNALHGFTSFSLKSNLPAPGGPSYLAALAGPSSLGPAQRPADLLRQRRTQLRSHIAPYAHTLALARQLDQRPVARAGLDANPVAVESARIAGAPRSPARPPAGAPPAKSSRRRPRAGHMPGTRRRAAASSSPGKRKDQYRALDPEKTGRSPATRRTARHRASPIGPA